MSRKFIHLISFVLVLSFFSSSVSRGADPTLVGWWMLDETSGTTAADSSSYGNTGTCQGNVAWVAGRISGAWQGDGTGDFIQVAHSDSLNISNAVTVAMWVYSTGAPTRQLICKGPFGSSTTWWASYGIRLGNTVPATGTRRANFRGNNPSSNLNCLNSNTDIPLNTWTHIAATFDLNAEGNNQKIYFNGNLDAENRQTTALTTNTGPVIIGADNYGAPNRWSWLGMLDDIRIYNRALTQSEIQTVMLGGGMVLTSASAPSPANNKTDVPRDVVLSWEPGIYANTHDVYFGTDATAVQNANTNDISGIYRGRKPKDPCSYDPPEVLKFSQVYYWRVDEVNGPPDYTIYPGSVWSFTSEPIAYRITPIAATASSSYSTDMMAGKTIDGSGLNANDQHSTTDTAMWLSSDTGPQPTWIQYEFDRVYKLYEMWVWNSNQSVEPAVGFGLKNVTIQYSTDGTNWTQLSGVPQFAQATGFDTYVHNTTVNFQGVAARFVKITANSNWGGGSLYGLSEVRFFHIPVRAREPNPTSGATGVALDNVVLSWRPGREAVSHKVYFSSNSRTVTSGAALVGTVSDNSYNLGPLELGRTYYWKIDEVNEAATPTTWQGDLWRFTTGDNLVADDFESYTNSDPNIIFKTWKDGVGYSPGNGTGSQAGYRDPNYAELSNIHGGRQAMPVDYNNTKSPYYSEVDRTFAATQDWTAHSPNLLSLWLRGHPASVGSFVENPAGVYTMTASGADIWNTADPRRPLSRLHYHDEFYYAYMQLSGDYAIAVKVESITNTNAYAKAGVMIRDSLDANSANAMMCITPSTTGGIRLQHRATAGGTSTTDANTANINAPYWISLTRQGTNFAAGYSPNGTDWSTLDNATVTMTDPVYIGLALTSHNNAATCTAVFSNVKLYTVPDYVPVTPSWTSQDIGIKSNIAAPVYVTLKDSSNNTATITHDDPNIALVTAYQEWLIPTARFTFLNPNLDLANIQKITLGVGGAGNRGTGTLYFDDIRLYGSRCMAGHPGPAADFTGGDCFVDHNDLNIMTNNWLISDYQVIPVAPSDANLVGWWKLNDGSGNKAIDSNDNGHPRHNGTLMNGAQWATGKIGGGLQFDGVNDYVDVNDPAYTTDLPRWTVCVWVTSPAAPSGAASSASGPVYRDSNYQLTWNHQTAASRGGVGVQVGGTWYPASFGALEANTWYHLAGTYDGETVKAYKDGILITANTAPSGNPNSETDTLKFGRHSATGTAQYFGGTIDDVRIYSRVLSHAEIASLAGRTTFTQPLHPLLTLENINMYEDGAIDLRDYAVLADTWLEEPLLWPPQLKLQSIWAYELKNDANCYDPGPPIVARDLHLEFNGAVYLIDTGPFTSFTGNKTNKITLSAGVVPANGRTIIRFGSTGNERTLNKWWWTDALHQRISKEMAGVGPSCKKIN
jgi:hypothetical protein